MDGKKPRKPKPGNSLAEAHPDVAEQWHPHKNGPTSPRDVTRGSKYRAWWVCPVGHEWEARVNNRTNGNGCPDCLRKPKPGNSLAEAHPDVAEQWHPHKNGDLTPRDVTRSSAHRAWWVCTEGHEWQALVYSRTNGSGCPDCPRKRKPKPGNSLAEAHPVLAKQWHMSRNGDLSSSDVTRGSHYRAWWVCIEGHEWEARVKDRTQGSGCPVCSGNQVLPGFNSLADVDPDLAEQWHPHKNGTMSSRDVTRSSNRKVWWQCSLGHEWEATVAKRTSGSGCPRCANNGTSEPERLLRKWFVNSPFVTVHPDEHVRVETPGDSWLVDIVGRLADVPSDIHPGVAIEYDGSYWHSLEAAVERDLRKTQDLLEAGYLVVRVREHDLPHLGLRHPNLLQVTYGDPLNANWETFELVKMLDSFFRFHWSLAANIV